MSEALIGVPLEGFAEFVRKVAAEGVVLLKNEGQMLPLVPEESYLILWRKEVVNPWEGQEIVALCPQ